MLLKRSEVTMGRYRIFLLGAGFSRAAGIPLSTEVLPMAIERSRRVRADNHLTRDLQEYLQYRERADGVHLDEKDVDFEDFIGFLDAEQHMWLRGSDTLRSDGNGGQLLLRRMIGQIIHQRTPRDIARLPAAYHRFAEQLDPTDTIITWNYDILLERLLEYHGKPYRLFPTRYKKVYATHAEGDDSREEIVISKLHGSLDWMYRLQYDENQNAINEMNMSAAPSDPVFGPHASHRVRPLTDGPRTKGDELARMYRLVDPDAFYAEHDPPASPYILAPSVNRMWCASPLLELWRGLPEAGGINLGLIIIGFSLPRADEHVRRIVYHIARNYQHFEPDLELGGVRKGPVVLIDLRTDAAGQQQLRERYRFLDWSRTRVHFQGFDEEAVSLLKA